MDKSWIDIGDIRSKEYVAGFEKFLEFATKNLTDYNSTICCPCIKCKNRYFKGISDVKFHCCLWGFHKAYKIWVYHGETYASLHETQNHESMSHFDHLLQLINYLAPK